MDSFNLQICSVFGKEYLRVDLADLEILEQVRSFLSNLDCVHHANISEGKRKHITVYLQSFYSTKDSYSIVEKALNEFGTNDSKKITQLQEHITIKKEKKMYQSQIDCIPENVPVVFISYSYDDEDHQKWVRKLSDDLRDHDIHSLLDEYEPSGTDLTEFMINGIERADKVIVIGTPRYSQKAKQNSGGVHFEEQIMSAQMFNGAKYKFVPVLRKGSFSTSFPVYIGSKKGFDFSNDDTYTNELEKLVNDINGTAAKSIPSVVNPSTKESVTPPSDITKSASGLKDYLHKQMSPYKGEKWLEKLLKAFDTYAMDRFLDEMPFKFESIILTSYDMWNALLNASAFTIHDTSLQSKIEDFFKAWKAVHGLTVHCYDLQTDNYYRFNGLKHDVFVSNDKEEAFIELSKRVKQLEGYYIDLIKYIKTNYPQIDLDETSNYFRKDNQLR